MDGTNYVRRRLSRALEQALDAIGVNEKIIELRRQIWLQIERDETAVKSSIKLISAYFFGSQSEGTTTPEMMSDTDTLLCFRNILVIEEQKRSTNENKVCYLLIQDDTTSSGYCVLQNPFVYSEDMNFKRDTKGRYLLQNKAPWLFHDDWHGSRTSREGPASHYITAFKEHIDTVSGLSCKSWPRKNEKEFRNIQRSRTWPGDKMIEDMIQSECFVVPTQSREHPNSDVEWRISFSSAERLLMFSLNVTQIRCYVLLKYVKKTVLGVIPKCENTISSYILKTTLFHTISQTPSHVWEENDLLACLNLCLVVLYEFISRAVCPHFIVPSNNLLLNRLGKKSQNSLLDTLDDLIRNNGQYLYNINLDNLGHLLRCPSDIGAIAHWTGQKIKTHLIKEMLSHLLHYFMESQRLGDLVGMNFMKFFTANIVGYFVECTDDKDKNAARVQISLRSSIIGSLMSSDCIRRGQPLSDEAFQWLLLGIQYSDVMSTRLKFASALYCSGDLECAKEVLEDVRDYYTSCLDYVSVHCACQRITKYNLPNPEECLDKMFVSKISTENILNRHVALCVFFTPSERYCIPKELQYEMYKTAFINAEPSSLNDPFTKWMISACVSPITYMYFLQYKLYETLGLEEQKNEAFKNLHASRDTHEHKETTLNIVGQFLENEGYLEIAFKLYCKSLQIERKINAARILICCNIYRLVKMCRPLFTFVSDILHK